MLRRSRACVCLLAIVTATVCGVGAARAGTDDPSAYTDPAPRPVQDERATNDVRRVLRASGTRTPVTTSQVHTGVVVVSPSAPRERRPPRADAPPPRARVRSAKALALNARGLAPSRRAGLPAPTDAVPPTPIALLVGAFVLAAGAGTVAVVRR